MRVQRKIVPRNNQQADAPLLGACSAEPLRIFSYGGGKQSVAALVLAAQGRIYFRHFVFAHVGEDTENPDTLAYFHDIAKPYADCNGIRIDVVRRTLRNGAEAPTLLEWVRASKRTIGIPVRMANGAPGNRSCTEMYKIRVIARYLKTLGASAARPAVLGMGISLDEFQRMRNASGFDHYTLTYPLIDLRLTRQQCVDIILDAGLPEPPKSSCWFCPYHRVAEWQEIAQTKPAVFADAVTLEDDLNGKRAEMGRDAIYLHSRCKPLREAVLGTEPDRDETTCDSGFCFM